MPGLVDMELGVRKAGHHVLGIAERCDGIESAGPDERETGDLGQAVPHIVKTSGFELFAKTSRGLGIRVR